VDFKTITDIIQSPLGIAWLLLVILYTGARRWWVFGWMYEEKAKECEDWKQIALQGTHIAVRATDALERSQ
jgi:hypothetical protein